MPVQECQKDGKSGHKWGSQGVCFIGSDSRARAAEVGRAIFAQEKRMNRIEILKAISQGKLREVLNEAIEKGANLAEIMDIGMTALMLHNSLHGRSTDDDGPEFDKSDLDGLFGALEKKIHPRNPKKKKKVEKERSPESTQTLLQQLKTFISKVEETPAEDSASTLQFTSTPSSEVALIKSIDEEQGLVTAIVLRPNVTDLHGDIYDAGEVEKACFNFNVRCRQTNVQHVEMADFDVVESYVAKSGFELGGGKVLAGDWVATMKLDPAGEHFAKVKSGDFTGFSIGCKASVETI